MRPDILYLLTSKRFIDLPHRGTLGREFRDIVSSMVNDDWELHCEGVWTHCNNLREPIPLQGWKIHLSTIPAEAEELLRVAAGVLIRNATSFKFLSDKRILRASHSKAWGRGSSGKFITAYPRDLESFKRLMEELHQALGRRFAGPYVLTDKRYKDSKVLHYRYGGMRPNTRLRADGCVEHVLLSPDGREVRDRRMPWFELPDWEKDVFADQAALAEPDSTELNNRYLVTSALHFSNSGGVYLAQDKVSDKVVLLKEARAHVHHGGDGLDARQMLRREYAILERIRDCGIAPRPIDLFEEWEHLFLVEEYLDGYLSLQGYIARHSILLQTRPTPDQVRAYLGSLRGIFSSLAAALDKLHGKGIVFGDLSPNNILFNPATQDLRLIDFEGAQELDGDRYPGLFTPGFGDPRLPAGAAPDCASDYYGFGMILLFLMTHVNPTLEIKPEIAAEALAEVARDFGWPEDFSRIIANLTNADPLARRSPQALLAELRPDWTERIRASAAVGERRSNEVSADLAGIVRDCCRYVKASAEYDREDRLFPAGCEVFETNPLGLAHGALGVLYALSRIENKVEPALLDRLGRWQISQRSYPPGLATGVAGLAWAMLEIGDLGRAEAILSQGVDHPLLPTSASLWHGAAGWGMANLKFWLTTGKGSYLEQALHAAESIVNSAREQSGGLCWAEPDGRVPYGLAHGAAGTGLFFLYLFAATGRSRWKDLAVKALDHDLAQAAEQPGGNLSWTKGSLDPNVVYPYWEYGSAGVGIACLRYAAALGDSRYRDVLERIYLDCDRKYAVYPGRTMGLAGICEFLCDAFQFTGEERFRASARRLADGLALFAIRENEGLAFPCNGNRISCDFAMGTAGIMLTLDRLVSGRPGDFLLDELLKGAS